MNKIKKKEIEIYWASKWCFCIHNRITQNGRGWKGPLWVI